MRFSLLLIWVGYGQDETEAAAEPPDDENAGQRQTEARGVMEGYLSLYQCQDQCHTFLLTWAEQTEDERRWLVDSTFVVTIIPRTQLGVIRNRVEGVDRLTAVRAEFHPARRWIDCYAALIDESRLPDPIKRCWESRIRKAATNLVDVELRSIPRVAAPYAI